jgi:hypothetical protein
VVVGRWPVGRRASDAWEFFISKNVIAAPLHYQGKVSKPASDGDLFGARGNDSFCSSGIVLAEKTILVREEIFD